MRKKQVAVIGATGFTGSELLRILIHHPGVDIVLITSESRSGEAFSDVHPFFKNILDTKLKSIDDIKNHDIDVAFLALPHGVSMDYVEKLKDVDFPIIDFSGDFRLSDPDIYEQWYSKTHTFPEGFEGAVYGIPEMYASQIKSAKLIANPGCYPTSVILAVAPLLRAGLIDPSQIIADSKSGVTGTGVKAKPVNHFSSVNENFRAYGLKTHRHSIEIQQKMQEFTDDQVSVLFTPHLLPVDRGILSTIYLKPSKDAISTQQLTEAYSMYDGCRFIRMVDQPPSIKDVRGTNFCDIHATYDERTQTIIVISVIDNLMKGAAGQAVQNMNIIFNWDEDYGLHQVPLYP
jgi:N-acetyl-gamma-glutamyl-phosphate reductase